jgi:hypothetical protein
MLIFKKEKYKKDNYFQEPMWFNVI